MRPIDADELLARMRERCDSCQHKGNRGYCLNLCEWREAIDEADDMPEIEMNVSAGVHHCAGDDGQTTGGLRGMTDVQKALSYAEGFLTAMAAVLQDREWVDGKVGNITATTAEVRKLLRSVATHTGCDESELRGLRKENEQLTAMVEEMRQAVSERTERIAKWTRDGVIPTDIPGEYVAAWKCNNCGGINTEKTAYCPGCGAPMEVERDEV